MTIDTVTLAPVRASNAEREAAVARLHDALGHGRLDLAEGQGANAGGTTHVHSIYREPDNDHGSQYAS